MASTVNNPRDLPQRSSDAWRPCLDSPANRIDRRGLPVGIDPPGCADVGVRSDGFGSAGGIVGRGRALDDDLEGLIPKVRRPLALHVLDDRRDLSDGIGLRDDPIPAEDALFR